MGEVVKLSPAQLTGAELEFLNELFILERDSIEPGLGELHHAILHNDVEAGIRAARRFSSLGVLMDEAQKKVTRS